MCPKIMEDLSKSLKFIEKNYFPVVSYWIIRRLGDEILYFLIGVVCFPPCQNQCV